MECVEIEIFVLLCFLPAQSAEFAPRKMQEQAQGAGTAHNQEEP